MDNLARLLDAGTILFGLMLIGLPFLAMGAGVARILETHVRRDRLISLFGASLLRNWLAAAVGGFLFPLCECGIAPVARSLSRQGVPASGVAMFLASAPVFNPITIGATLIAFPTRPEIWIGRIVVSQCIVLALGWIFEAYRGTEGTSLPLIREDTADVCETPKIQGIRSDLVHVYEDFRSFLPSILFGAASTALIQIFVPKTILTTLLMSSFTAVPAAMFLAFVLSTCSSVDAFVILPFAASMPFAGLIAFLTFGPLVDLKNVFLYRRTFNGTFVAWYMGLATIMVLLTGAFLALI